MVAAVVTAIVGVLIARSYAARRSALIGPPGFIWFRFGLTLFIGTGLVGAGLKQVDSSLVSAAFLVTFGLAMAYLGWRYVQSVIKSVAAASTPERKADAVISTLADYTLGIVALSVVALIVLGLLSVTGLLR